MASMSVLFAVNAAAAPVSTIDTDKETTTVGDKDTTTKHSTKKDTKKDEVKQKKEAPKVLTESIESRHSKMADKTPKKLRHNAPEAIKPKPVDDQTKMDTDTEKKESTDITNK